MIDEKIIFKYGLLQGTEMALRDLEKNRKHMIKEIDNCKKILDQLQLYFDDLPDETIVELKLRYA